MVKEIQAGRGTPFGGVVLDLRHSNTMFPKAQEDFLRYKGIDIRTSLIQLTMGHQCSNGGLCIDTNAMTDVPGVFAAGEVTAGMHGADRIGGNMLTSCLVFGARAGNAAASWAKAHKVSDDILQTARVKVDKIRAIASSTGRTSPESLLQTLQKSAWNHALTVRSEKSLMMMLFDIQQFLHEFSSSLAVSTPADLIHALELRNLLLVGELVAKSALQRRESRGGHYREDYPECDYQSPSQAIILQQTQGQIIQVTETVIDPDWRYDDNDLGQERWG
jgi:L-aspartate oxidase